MVNQANEARRTARSGVERTNHEATTPLTVYLDRLFLLSNLSGVEPIERQGDWQGSKCKCKCFAAFSLKTKSLTLNKWRL